MRIRLITICSFISLLSFSQDHGYFGKKNTLSININASNPLIYNYLNSGVATYKASGNGVVIGKSQIDYGYSGAFSHYFSGNFGLGAEVAATYGKINTDDSYTIFDPNSFSYEYVSLDVEQLSIRTITIMPKIEFNPIGDQLPVGINHQIGFGVSTTKLLEKDYKYRLVSANNGNAQFGTSLYAPYQKVGKYYNLTAMYAFNIRTPISKSLMINYGLRYNLNFALSSLIDELGFGTDNYNNSNGPAMQIRDEIRQKRISSIMNFNIGITYVF